MDTPRLTWIAVIAAVLVLAMGLTVVIGWYEYNLHIVQILPGLAAMQFNTALSFVLAAGAFLTLLYGRWRWMLVLIGCLALIGVLTLIEYTLGVDFGIDQLLMEAPASIPNPHPGRMGVNTAVCFVLLSAVLLLVARPWRIPRRLFSAFVLACGVVVLAGAAFFGYIASLVFGGDWGLFTQMALHTSIGFLLLGIVVVVTILHRIRNQDKKLFLGSPVVWLVLVIALMLTAWTWFAVNTYDDAPTYAPTVVLSVGIPASLLLFGIVWYLSDTRNRALALQRELAHQSEQLRRSNRELEQFAYVATHDLRAPILNLRALMNMFVQEGFCTEQNRLLTDKIDQSITQLHATLHDLIEIVIHRKNLDGRIEEVSFENILSKVMDRLSDRVERECAKVESDFSRAPVVRYMAPHIETIMYNLVDNSIKYRDRSRNPVIAVRTVRKGDTVSLFVEDNGIGIAPKDKEKIFGLFKRLTVDVEGKGMGLFIVKSQVEAMGGSVEVEGGPGKGSTFIVYLKDQKWTTEAGYYGNAV